ncbi:hypothetical protein C5167_045888 [Papaver somniferum]|uniref:Uncharacterized protein n=1 Tax=Papaver somniferum TaxID=3469 RepID=A0A4Y7LEI3_PAPSO|nr:hypothetical protein C5167_045888 [Papaver somniferum]
MEHILITTYSFGNQYGGGVEGGDGHGGAIWGGGGCGGAIEGGKGAGFILNSSTHPLKSTRNGLV